MFEGGPGPSAGVRLRDPALHWKLLLRPRLFVPEAYMNGSLTIEEGTLYDLMDVLVSNDAALPGTPLLRLNSLGGRWFVACTSTIRRPARGETSPITTTVGPALRAVPRPRPAIFLRLFPLARRRLDIAQDNKKRHIAAKLLLRPGQKVLDIGSGWGGLALYLAAECGVDVTGLTLSEEQHKLATRRAAEAGLADRVRFHLRDYREETGAVRPHRLGRHVRACRGGAIPHFFSKAGRALGA